MLAVMFWDDEQKQKARVEEKLRKKKEERRGERLKVTQVVEEAPHTDSGSKEELLHQTELINSQQEELVALRHLMLQQGQMLRQILEKQDSGVVREVVIQPPDNGIREEESDLPSLQDINIDVIKTEGIETTGEAGEKIKEGQSIKDRASRLRALIQKR